MHCVWYRAISVIVSGYLLSAVSKPLIAFSHSYKSVAQLLLWQGSQFAIWTAYAFLGLFTVTSLNANRAYIAAHADNKGSVYGVFYAESLSSVLWVLLSADMYGRISGYATGIATGSGSDNSGFIIVHVDSKWR